VKTGPGEYGEGDVFVGLTVPILRKIAKRYRDLSFDDITILLDSKIHEERSAGLMILGFQFEKGDEAKQKETITFYLKKTKQINNWDLVDESAWMLGRYLLGRDYSILYRLAKSKLLWDRRIAMIATHEFIQTGDSKVVSEIAELLLHDSEDLMHKAVGWMLREMGSNSGRATLEKFLAKHYKVMPRTTLRYAIEHFPEERRQMYLKGKI
jgi:3-methyladenine DNA glycosylase AlkD